MEQTQESEYMQDPGYQERLYCRQTEATYPIETIIC